MATHGGIVTNPLPVRDAVEHVREWLRHPRVRIVNRGNRHAEIFDLLAELGTAGNLTTDAHLAALASE
jgi:predicted nucleic acid-binding protein